MPLTLLSQIELGVKRVSLRVRSIVQLVDPADTGGSAYTAFTSGCAAIAQNRCCPHEKRSAAEILCGAGKPVLKILKLS
jgi:hypothetical protein